MREINILGIQRISAADARGSRRSIRRIRLDDAGGWFDGEIRETWPALCRRALSGPRRQRVTERARNATGCSPKPKSSSAAFRFRSTCAPARRGSNGFTSAPPARATCWIGDLWGSDVVVTTSRGVGSTAADRRIRGRRHPLFRQGPQPRRARPRGRRLRPSRLSPAAARGQDGLRRRRRRHRPRCRPAVRRRSGMRVVGTRREPQPGALLPAGFSEIGGAGDLDRFLPHSDFVVICCQWTPETTGCSTPSASPR